MARAPALEEGVVNQKGLQETVIAHSMQSFAQPAL